MQNVFDNFDNDRLNFDVNKHRYIAGLLLKSISHKPAPSQIFEKRSNECEALVTENEREVRAETNPSCEPRRTRGESRIEPEQLNG